MLKIFVDENVTFNVTFLIKTRKFNILCKSV